jgi:DNA-binding HxlR family transcriptional regulator
MAARLKTRVRAKKGSPFDRTGQEKDEEEIVDSVSCPMVRTIRTMVSESRLIVVRHLLEGPKGFNELMRTSGINSKTLSITLKYLEDRGVVVRRIVSTRPFKVQYSLSQSGEDLKPVLNALGEWGTKWLPKLLENPIHSG